MRIFRTNKITRYGFMPNDKKSLKYKATPAYP